MMPCPSASYRLEASLARAPGCPDCAFLIAAATAGDIAAEPNSSTIEESSEWVAGPAPSDDLGDVRLVPVSGLRVSVKVTCPCKTVLPAAAKQTIPEQATDTRKTVVR